MIQYDVTSDLNILHQLFIGGTDDLGMEALLKSILNQIL